jgi:hypothetical protein
MATLAEALTVKCPLCGAAKGQPCVYMPVLDSLGNERTVDSWTTLVDVERINRVGLPTIRPHNDRCEVADAKRRRAARKVQQDAYMSLNAASRDRMAVLRSNAQAVTDEHHQLTAWLRQNWRIFQ